MSDIQQNAAPQSQSLNPELVEVSTVEVMRPQKGFRLFQSRKTERMNVLMLNNRAMKVAEIHELLAMARYAVKVENSNKDMNAMLMVEREVLAQRQARVEELSNSLAVLNAQYTSVKDENAQLKATLTQMTEIIEQMERNAAKGKAENK